MTAVILGIIAMAKGKAKRLAGASDGPAIFGIILGFLAFLLSSLMAIIFLVSIAMEGA